MARRFTFPKSRHLRTTADFERVYQAKTRESRGPLTIYAKPNDLPHSRLGMSVSRRVGIGVRRNRIRRLLRETFRLMQHDHPIGLDLVVVVRTHEPLRLAEYQKMLSEAVFKLQSIWRKRAASAPTIPPPTTEV